MSEPVFADLSDNAPGISFLEDDSCSAGPESFRYVLESSSKGGRYVDAQRKAIEDGEIHLGLFCGDETI